MARMIRKQVYIEPEQEAKLKRCAKEQGVTEAALIRRGIDTVTAGAGPTYRDRQAWDEELAFLAQRALIPALGGKRSWTREELYEERLARFSR
jgi:hypothetical protein